MNGEQEIRDIVFDPRLNLFAKKSLAQSLSAIGYPEGLLRELFEALAKLDCAHYGELHADELYQLHAVHFLGELAGGLFRKYVLPEIPAAGKVIDIGCGTGTLIKELLARGDTEVVGVDIDAYPEWAALRKQGIRVEEVSEERFPSFMKAESPDAVVMTWVLHHMDYPEQEEYLKVIFETLKSGSRVVTLEDSYSTELPPETGKALYDDFMALDAADRKRIMSAFDWIANRVLERRDKIPMPFGFRTLEEWRKLFEQTGFEIVKARFLGFPADRDVNNGQSLLVAVKR